MAVYWQLTSSVDTRTDQELNAEANEENNKLINLWLQQIHAVEKI